MKEARSMRPKRNPEVVWRLEKGLHAMAWEKAKQGEEYEDLGVLTLMVRGSIHQLNLVGAEIWTRINGVNTAEKIAREVAALFESDPAETAEDVAAFLADIEKKGWVVLPDAGPAAPDPRWTAR
jgi:pyrroloquinoline quinone biosynthesis protein D